MNHAKHKFVNPKADGGDTTVTRPSNWNAQHDIGILLTNRTIGELVEGDVVALSGAHDEGVILGDTLDSTQSYVVAQDVIAADATGLFTQDGVVNVKVGAAVVRGNYLAKSAAAKALYDTGVSATGTIPPSGAVGIALEAAAGAGLIAAYLWGHTATGGGGKKGADIASAAAITIPSDVTYAHITGTSSISSIAIRPAGTRVILEFDSSVLLNHSSQLILIGNRNIGTQTGDVLEFVSEGSGNWRQVAPKIGVFQSILLPNASGVFARTVTNSADVILIYLDASNSVTIGPGGSTNIRITGQLRCDIDPTARAVAPVGVNKWAV